MADQPVDGDGSGRITIGPDGTVLALDAAAAATLARHGDDLVGRKVALAGEGSEAIAIVAAVGHELRSPLTSIRGYTSLLLNRWDRIGDDDKKLMLGQISHDAERVTRLINELLDISRLETGRLHLARRPIDLVAVAGSVVAAFRSRSAGPDGAADPAADGAAPSEPALDVTVAFPDPFPPVPADADKIEQVLTNLVENAVKYGSPVGLRIEGAVADGCVSVSVCDQGPGIAPGDLDRVFDRWFQKEHGRPTGTGLGLWISRGIVEAHGGTLTVDSVVGEGASFTFTLPLVAPVPADA
jgi:signal transduction histidine kinase